MFNSPFPPLKPTIKYKTALERAGFDVNTSANNSVNNGDFKSYSPTRSTNMDSPSSTFIDDSANSIILVNKSLQKKQKLLMRKQQEQQADPKNKNKNKKGSNKNVLDDLSPPKINAGSSAISIASQNSSIKTNNTAMAHLKINTDKPPVSAVFGLKSPSANTSFNAIHQTQSNVISNHSPAPEADVSHISNLNMSNDEVSKIQANNSKESLLNSKLEKEKQLASESFMQQIQEQDYKEKTEKPKKEEEFKREITPPIHTINNLADLQFDQESFYSEIQSQDPRINNIDDQSDERMQFISEQPYEASEHSSYHKTSNSAMRRNSFEEDTFDFNESSGYNSNNGTQLDFKATKNINPSDMFLDSNVYYDKEISEGKLALQNEKHIPPSGFNDVEKVGEQEPDVSKLASLNINEDHDIFNPSEENDHFENVINGEKFDNVDEATGTFFSAKEYIDVNDEVEGLNFDSPEKTNAEEDDYEGKTTGIDNDMEEPLNFNEAQSVKQDDDEEETPIGQQHQSVNENVCRGCLNTIQEDEKTIYDKNGELSGKWHKKCFSCKQCNIKFSRQTPCYIHEDEPFCEQHFFEVTGLICFGCHNRILDDFCLDVMGLGKAHIGCFKCNECGTGIQDEYFSNKDVNLCVDCVRKRGNEDKMQRRRTVLWDAN